MKAADIRLNSPGPVASAFLHDDSFVSICIGPVGSGKTLTGLQKGLRLAARQMGVRDANGIVWRRSRIGVLRETYPAIDANILQSWFRLVPRDVGKFSQKAPYTHHFRKAVGFDADTGKPNDILDIIFEFKAIGEGNDVQSVMRGWELNALLVDEADIQPAELVSYASGRIGRFSALDPRTVVDPQIILISNMPYEDNWLFQLAFGESFGDAMSDADKALLAAAMPGRKLISTFVQPGGNDPGAENLHNLLNGRAYFQVQTALNAERDPDYVDRMINNKPVPRRYGQPVYPDFNYGLHRSKEPLKYDPSRPLIIGIDQGVYAAAVFLQYTREAQLRVLREVVKFKTAQQKLLKKLGPVEFGKAVAQMLNELAPDIDPDGVIVRADPAAFQASEREDNEIDWVRLVQAQLPAGIKIRKAKTNSPALRQGAVRKHQSVLGGYLVDPSCSTLIAAHMGKYHYIKSEIGSGETRGTLPVLKNLWSNVADAEQYGALEGEHVIGDLRGKPRKRGAAKGRVSYGTGYFSGRSSNVSSR